MDDKPELAWTLSDYLERGQEPPDRLIRQPESCEGELMSDDEVISYIRDALGALLVMADSGSSSFLAVRDSFFADLKFLVAIGRLDAEQYNEITNEENYRF